ncbi:MAG: OmpA family protein [Prevotella sp.]|nr:OmpA family protein [Prevotella sp.]
MKKFLIVLAFASVSMATMAQDADPTLKYSVATNSFWSNWFIQAGANWNAWYSGQEHGQDLAISPIEKFRSNPGAAVAIGKWFTPGLGLRTKVQGIWGKNVTDDDNDYNCNKYWIAQEHILFNVSNLLLGYNPKRVWNFIPFVGGGVGRSMTNNFYATGLSAGILNEFRLSKHVALNLEAGWNRYEGDLDGNGRTALDNRGWDSHDNNLYAELGLTFNLGKATWEKTPDVDAIKSLAQSQIDALNAKLNDANGEIDRLNNLIKNHKCPEATQPTSVKELVATPVSVFFNLDKYNIASQKDLVNVKGIATYAKENNLGLKVDGYADSATGKAPHNQWLSEKRAETVANELVKMGVSRDKITTKGHGGVNELSPIQFNRRATVQVTE